MIGHTNEVGFSDFLPFKCYDSTREQKALSVPSNILSVKTAVK